MTLNTGVDLKTPHAQNDQAKVRGAQSDTEKRTWNPRSKT